MTHLAGTLAVLLATLSLPTTIDAGGSSADGLAPEQDLVTREWTWADAEGVTTFTAQGPADQVAAFEPGDPPSRCPDCMLLSSVAFGELEGAASPAIDPDPPATLDGQDR